MTDDGYQIINGLTNPPATEQDKLIAAVQLAGCRIEKHDYINWEGSPPIIRYRVYTPDGTRLTSKPTRYAAALAAEAWLWESYRDGKS